MRLSAAKPGTALAECLSVHMPSPVRVYMEELTRESLDETQHVVVRVVDGEEQWGGQLLAKADGCRAQRNAFRARAPRPTGPDAQARPG